MTRVRFIGSGDSFGSGGRFQTCIVVDADGYRFLIDRGATSLVALKKAGVDPGSIDAVLLTHFHGDHCGGSGDRATCAADPRGRPRRGLYR